MNKLIGPSFLFNKNPKKLIFLLHGYGDNAENFSSLATYLNEQSLEANFFVPNAPFSVPQYPSGRQWFDPYPNGIHYDQIGSKEKATMEKECKISIKHLEKYMKNICFSNNLSLTDSFIIGFSQGAMIAYAFGQHTNSLLAGCIMISGRVLTSATIENSQFIRTPLMIIHGDKDEIVNPKYYYEACKINKAKGFFLENHLMC